MNNIHIIIIIVLVAVLIAMMVMRPKQELFAMKTPTINVPKSRYYWSSLNENEDRVLYKHKVKLSDDQNEYLWIMNNAVRAYDRIFQIAAQKTKFGQMMEMLRKNPSMGYDILNNKDMKKETIIFAQNLVKRHIMPVVPGKGIVFNGNLMKAYLTLGVLIYWTYVQWLNTTGQRNVRMEQWVADPNTPKGLLTNEAISLYRGLHLGFQYLGYSVYTSDQEPR